MLKSNRNRIFRIVFSIFLGLVSVFAVSATEYKGNKSKTKGKSKSKTAYHKKKSSYKKKKKYAPQKPVGIKDSLLYNRKIIISQPTILENDLSLENNSNSLISTFELSDVYLDDSSFDLYGIFDTVNVNPYKLDLGQIPDSVSIKLAAGNEDCDYHHPFRGNVTSAFGPRWGRQHCGIDIDLETGDTVKSAFEGVVRIARRSPSFGNVVMVRHKNGLETIYAHLSRLDVTPGQTVEAGEIIGLGGNTGKSRGSHLHFEVRYKGYPIDPMKIISFDEYKLLANEIVLTKDYLFSYTNKHNALHNKGKTKFYKVRKGDNLSKIARKLGTTTSVLKRLNKLNNQSKLIPGKVLKYI